MSNLRDHSQPCGHDKTDRNEGAYEWAGTWRCAEPSCPGGRTVTINYEAAARWTHAEMVRRGPTDLTWESAYPEEQADHLNIAHHSVNAALGIGDTDE